MSGRIRTIKPEWLEDEKLCSASTGARLLSIALIILADDYGRGRGNHNFLGVQVFPTDRDALLATGEYMAELESIGFITQYVVREQMYYEIRNWAKHQRVDKPGKPRVPAPGDADELPSTQAKRKPVYFIRGTSTGLIKIGESIDPIQRLTGLAACGSEELELLFVANDSGTEKEFHRKLSASRVHGEWFSASDEVLSEIRSLGGNPDKPIARAGYDNRKRITESFANDSGAGREEIRTDLRSPTSYRVPRTDDPTRASSARTDTTTQHSSEVGSASSDSQERGDVRRTGEATPVASGTKTQKPKTASDSNDSPWLSRAPSSLDEALTWPLRERATSCLRFAHSAEWCCPHDWPEVKQVAHALADALGQKRAVLGSIVRDSGVRAVVGLFADGVELAPLVDAVRRAGSDDWFRTGRKGLSSLTIEVYRRLSQPAGESAPRGMTTSEAEAKNAEVEARRAKRNAQLELERQAHRREIVARGKANGFEAPPCPANGREQMAALMKLAEGPGKRS